MSEQERITLDTAAKKAGISRQKLDEYIKEGVIQSHHATGYCQYVYADDLAVFMDRREKVLRVLASPSTAHTV